MMAQHYPVAPEKASRNEMDQPGDGLERSFLLTLWSVLCLQAVLESSGKSNTEWGSRFAGVMEPTSSGRQDNGLYSPSGPHDPVDLG